LDAYRPELHDMRGLTRSGETSMGSLTGDILFMTIAGVLV
jgi:hypothetical protein